VLRSPNLIHSTLALCFQYKSSFSCSLLRSERNLCMKSMFVPSLFPCSTINNSAICLISCPTFRPFTCCHCNNPSLLPFNFSFTTFHVPCSFSFTFQTCLMTSLHAGLFPHFALYRNPLPLRHPLLQPFRLMDNAKWSEKLPLQRMPLHLGIRSTKHD
jgi:hypothetical protein